MLRRVVPSGSGTAAAVAVVAESPSALHGGVSKPLEPLGSAQLAASANARRVRALRRRFGADVAALAAPRFADGIELFDNGMELHLASVRFSCASISLESVDHPKFAALKAEFNDVLAPGLPPDRAGPRDG